MYFQILGVLFCLPKIEMHLLVQPALRTRIECLGESNGHFRTDTCTTIQYRRQSLAANAKSASGIGDRDAQRLKAQIAKNFSGVGWIVHSHVLSPLVIIFVINDFGIFAIKSECDAPVSAHAYRPCPFSISGQFMQSKSGQIHVSRRGRGVKPRKDQADSLFVVRLNAGLAAFSKISLKSTMPNTLDHACNVTRGVTGVKQDSLAATTSLRGAVPRRVPLEAHLTGFRFLQLFPKQYQTCAFSWMTVNQHNWLAGFWLNLPTHHSEYCYHA